MPPTDFRAVAHECADLVQATPFLSQLAAEGVAVVQRGPLQVTDFREQRLKDGITKREPMLFKRVTGLTTEDFERLVRLGVFNSALMNDAVWKFRRYEDASLR